MNIDKNNTTASGATDAPQIMAVVKNTRRPPLALRAFALRAWNIRTTNDSDESCRPERATAIICSELKRLCIDICALSEVRRPGTGNIVEKSHDILEWG